MSSSDVIALVAAVISVVSAVMAWLTYRRGITAERRARMPALVFKRDDSESSQLMITNVGVGPAMNIVYAQCDDRELAIRKGFHEPWFNPIHLRPIQPGEQVPIRWEVPGAGLGLRYTDAFGFPYVVKSGDYGMRIFEGASHLPRWSLEGMPYLWEVVSRAATLIREKWGQCAPGQSPPSSALPTGGNGGDADTVRG